MTIVLESVRVCGLMCSVDVVEVMMSWQLHNVAQSSLGQGVVDLGSLRFDEYSSCIL
jgi:hypothetical protein